MLFLALFQNVFIDTLTRLDNARLTIDAYLVGMLAPCSGAAAWCRWQEFAWAKPGCQLGLFVSELVS